MKTELRRQFIHFLFGSAIIALVAIRGVQESLLAISIAFIVGLAVSWMIKKEVKFPVLTPLVEKVERHYEKTLPGKGALLFFLGAIIAMALFQRQEIVLGALCVAVYGDAASTIVGMRFGRRRIAGKKTLEGTVGGILVSAGFLLALFQWPVALATAVVGMAAELLPVDDNFTIPIAVGLVLTFLV